MTDERISRVGVIGTGLIGAAWVALFLAKGKTVVAVDPGAGAEQALHAEINRVWPDLRRLWGGAESPDFSRLDFHPEIGAHLGTVRFIQESAPENAALKRKLFAELEAWIPAATPIASSTSALLISDLQPACKHPERCLAAHPFNPAHLLPLVEISGGALTGDAVLTQAAEFYRTMGKHPVILKREIEGHIAGRLSAAMWREAVSLVEKGITSVEDIDAAIRHGPGLRLAISGPFLSYHFGGGDGGISGYLEHLGASQQKRWESLGTPELSDELNAEIVEGVEQEVKGATIQELTRERDALLLALLRARGDLSDRGA